MKTLNKYGHIIIMPVYLALYMAGFNFLEKSTTAYNIIHVPIDDIIPFIEYFIVPYLLWFPLVIFVCVYLAYINKSQSIKLSAFLGIGMTAFLIISYVYPNGQQLRPDEFAHDNAFTDMVKLLYSVDTPTNIFPSVHVYNTLGVLLAVYSTPEINRNRPLVYGATILSVLIILSTVFLKQHSMVDVVGAFGMASVVHYFIYRYDPARYGHRKQSEYRI